MTNGSGVATAPTLTANATAGSYTVTASAPGVATPANFSLTNTAGPAARVSATAGTPQSTVVNTAFGTALQATVLDAGSNPVSGRDGHVHGAGQWGERAVWRVGDGDGDDQRQRRGDSADADGERDGGQLHGDGVRAGRGDAGQLQPDEHGGAAATVTATAGTPQSTVINTAFGTALQATVRDAGNNPVAGVTVTFTAPANGASARFGGIGDGDGDDQRQRGGDGADADGQWDGGQLHRDGDGAGRGDAGQFA